MALSFWQILLVVVLFLLLFGRGKIPQLMSDVATGIKSFKKGMQEDEATSREKTKSEQTASLSASMKQDKSE